MATIVTHAALQHQTAAAAIENAFGTFNPAALLSATIKKLRDNHAKGPVYHKRRWQHVYFSGHVIFIMDFTFQLHHTVILRTCTPYIGE